MNLNFDKIVFIQTSNDKLYHLEHQIFSKQKSVVRLLVEVADTVVDVNEGSNDGVLHSNVDPVIKGRCRAHVMIVDKLDQEILLERMSCRYIPHLTRKHLFTQYYA